MIPIKTVRFIIVLLAVVFVFVRMCIAGTWIDDFSDRTLRDWGGGVINDEFSATVVDGHFNYRGKNQDANFRFINWGLGKIQDFSLELKFMVRNVRVPTESGWSIQYEAVKEETRELEGFLDFEFRYSLGAVVEPNVAFVTIYWNVPKDNPKIGHVVLRPNAIARARFVYKKEVWYTLKIERDGNEYIFWIGDIGLFLRDEILPIGSIGIRFHGRCTIWLDDFTVTGPTVPDGGPGVLGVNPLAELVTTMWGKLKAQN